MPGDPKVYQHCVCPKTRNKLHLTQMQSKQLLRGVGNMYGKMDFFMEDVRNHILKIIEKSLKSSRREWPNTKDNNWLDKTFLGLSDHLSIHYSALLEALHCRLEVWFWKQGRNKLWSLEQSDHIPECPVIPAHLLTHAYKERRSLWLKGNIAREGWEIC